MSNYPEEVKEWAMDQQEKQGNPRDWSVFEDNIGAWKKQKGFNWRETEDGLLFCYSVLEHMRFDIFFEKYPKDNGAHGFTEAAVYNGTTVAPSEMKVKIKRLHPDAVIPFYAKSGDAGMDLTVTEMEPADTNHTRYKFGLAMEIPDGHVGFIFPRSSVYKQAQSLSNAVGVVDAGYRGEVMAVMRNHCPDRMYKKGDRAAQLIIMTYPQIEFVEANELTKTERGAGGYGSTGK